MEPVYRPYRESEGGEQLYTVPKSATGVGQMYHEVERLRRTYSDMEAEKANQLSILPNFEAVCRLIHIPGGGKRPSLVERHIQTEVLGDKNHDPKIAALIQQRSRKMALPREEVEKEIALRSHGSIHELDVAASEKIV